MLQGDPVDRAPFCLYPHFDQELLNGDTLAALVEAFVEKVEPDVVAVPWTYNYTLPSGASLDRPGDLNQISAVHGRHGAWSQQLDAIRRVCLAFHGKRPVVSVVPSAFRQLERLSSIKLINESLRESPGFLFGALEQLNRSLIAFIKEAVKIGVSGIVVEESAATHELWSPAQYKEKALPLLQAQVGASQPAWTAVQFVGRRLFWEELGELRCQGLGWPVASGPGLIRGAQRWKGFVWGGLDPAAWPESSRATLRGGLVQTMKDFPATPVILAPPAGLSGLRPDQLEALGLALRRMPSPEMLRETLEQREERLAALPKRPQKRKEAREPFVPVQLEAPKPAKGARTRLRGQAQPAEPSAPTDT
jgi:hypothetical protein